MQGQARPTEGNLSTRRAPQNNEGADPVSLPPPSTAKRKRGTSGCYRRRFQHRELPAVSVQLSKHTVGQGEWV